MKILSTKWFNKWAKKSKLGGTDLIEAVGNLEQGLSTANLGNHLFKVRVKKAHSGKSSGFRTIVVYQNNNKAIFLYGFEKNERSNIDNSELQYFKKFGNDLLNMNEEQVDNFIEQKILFNVEVKK
ncbi:MAG: hypothetical protein GQ582_07635 [Methyloprofundus sp.]|nr:hypothetical protein [Methyloprofundus sp.]